MRYLLLLLFIFQFSATFSQEKRQFKRLWKKTQTELYRKNFRAADSLLTEALKIKPDNAKAIILHANVLFFREKFAEAADKFETAIKMKPEAKELYLLLSDSYMALNQPQKAEETLLKVIKFKSKLIPAFQKLTYARIELKKFNDALKDASRAIALDPTLHESHYIKAVCFDSLKDYPSARITYEKAISLLEGAEESEKGVLPVYQPYYVNLAKAYNELALYDLSITTFNKALAKIDPQNKAKPDDYLIYYYRSKPYYNKTEYSSSIADLNKSLALNNKFADAFIFRARVYNKTSQFHSAISDYTKAVQFVNSSQLLHERGKCQYELGKFPDALEDFKKSYDLDNKNVSIKTDIEETMRKIYEMNKEAMPPIIKLIYPVPDSQGFINLSIEQEETILVGEVADQSALMNIMVNGREAVYFKEGNLYNFKVKLNNKKEEKLEITALDIYNNKSKLDFKVGKILSDSRLRYNFTGTVISGEGDLKPLENLTVHLLNKRGEKIASTKTNEKGYFNFESLPYDKSEFTLLLDSSDTQLQLYNKIIIADKSGSKPILVAEKSKNKTFSFSVLPYDPISLELMEVDDVALNMDIKGRLINGEDMKSPLSAMLVHLVNDKGEIIDSKKTDAFGAFLFSRIAKSRNYSIRLDSSECAGLTCSKIIITDEKGKVLKQMDKSTGLEFVFELLPTDQFYLATITEEDPWMRTFNLSVKKKELEIIESIYYPSGSWELLPDADPVMQKLVNALKNNPKVSVTVESHTDSQAGDDFNFELSNKRALTVVDYLVKAGIDKTRVAGVGLGENKLTNRCANGVDCSDAEHRQNRRTVFKLKYIE